MAPGMQGPTPPQASCGADILENRGQAFKGLQRTFLYPDWPWYEHGSTSHCAPDLSTLHFPPLVLVSVGYLVTLEEVPKKAQLPKDEIWPGTR